MKPTTRLQSGSFVPTTTSADRSLPHGQSIQTATNPTVCPVIQIDLNRDKAAGIPAGHIAIEDFIAESEKDEERATALEEARQWVADNFYKGEGESIRVLRLKKGLSQAKLAALASTTQPHIARIETGAADCQIGTLQRIAAALGIDVLLVVKAFINSRELTLQTSANE
jgi:ribosome-binding protein aMBF1 (putative translation factor)